MRETVARAYRFVKVYGQHLPMAAKAIFTFSCTVQVIEGRVRGSGQPLQLLYIGRHWNDEFLLELIFEDYEILTREKTNLFKVRASHRNVTVAADVEVLDIGWPYVNSYARHGDYVTCPDWINMDLPICDDWQDTVRSFRQSTRNNDLRLIRRNDYQYVVTNDEHAIDTFYEEMYRPTVQARHGKASIVAPKKHVLKRAQQGKLLQVSKDGELVIAGVIYPEDDVLFFLWQGIASKYQKRLPEAAVSALYFFGIRYASDNGIEMVDFAGTRAFLDFGDFRFKRKWGARVDDSFSPSSILFRPLSNGDSTIAFFEHFPMIVRCDEGLEAVIVKQADAMDADTVTRLDKHYSCNGLVRKVVIKISEDSPAIGKNRAKESNGIEVIECSREQFSRCYVTREPVSD